MRRFFLFMLMIIGYYSTAFAQAKSPAADGKKLYTQFCLTCHQADGKGVPNMNPPLIQTSYVLGDKKKLISWVLKGSGEEKVPIDGKYYNNNMPPQAALKDENVAAILTYIRNNFSNKASAVTAVEVKTVRASL